VAFPLHPETPEAGLTLQELFQAPAEKIQQKVAYLRQVAQELGLPFGDRKKTFNSRLAQELGKWAESQARGDSFHHAVFRAYFVEGKNIGQRSTLIEIAEAVGLSAEEALAVLEHRPFRPDVDADWARARMLAITAVPTLVLNGRRLVGAQPYPVMEKFIADHSIPETG